MSGCGAAAAAFASASCSRRISSIAKGSRNGSDSSSWPKKLPPANQRASRSSVCCFTHASSNAGMRCCVGSFFFRAHARLRTLAAEFGCAWPAAVCGNATPRVGARRRVRSAHDMAKREHMMIMPSLPETVSLPSEERIADPLTNGPSRLPCALLAVLVSVALCSLLWFSP